MAQIDKNTVSAKGQLGNDPFIRIHYPEHTGLRVMFIGNSITLHGVLKSIGWENEWGMAASSIDKDYVHLLEQKILKKHPDASFCICQVAEWERNYFKGEQILENYAKAREFDADVLLFRMVENVPNGEDFDCQLFEEQCRKLIKYLGGDRAKLLLSTSFWHHKADEGLRTVANDDGYPLIELGDLGENDENKAIGKFWHDGVANHPGDLGMKRIADRIFDCADKNGFFD